MSVATTDAALDVIKQRQAAQFYPESDGKPMANNTEQFEWIATIKGNLDILASDRQPMFVAGDLLWYPVEGNNQINIAPDVMVAIGRPKGKRGSYMQWVEANIPPQVVFEILSPGNRRQEMAEKFEFFQRYGVEEYYLYDPARGRLNGWLRNQQQRLTAIPDMQNWNSPRLGIRFFLKGLELQIFNPDGSRFLSFLEINERLEQAEKRAFEAIWEIDQAEIRAEQAEIQAEQAVNRAEQAVNRAEQAENRAEQAERQKELEVAARLALEAKLKEMEAQLKAAGLKS